MAFFGTVEKIKDRVETVTQDMIKHRNCRICILPDSVKVIAQEAFRNCKQLEKLLFVDEEGNFVDNKIEVIGMWAFMGTKIKEFTYSHHLKQICSKVFDDTPLSSFRYKDHDNMESNLALADFSGTMIKELVIPPSLKIIGVNTKILTSLICKDKDGNIVENKNIHEFFSSDSIKIKNLKEISLIGCNLKEIRSIIRKIPSIEKIHVSMESFSYCRCLYGDFCRNRNLHFVLHGNADSTYSCHALSLFPDQNTITITFAGKTREINCGFFKYLANSELVIPEGVEFISDLDFTKTNLKILSLPSTLKTISRKNYDDKRYSITVSVYSTIQIETYRNLCSYLEPTTSKIIINGNLTEQEKNAFKSLSPNELTLKFRKLPCELSTSIQEKTFSYQTEVDKLKQELMNLMDLMPDDLKLKIKDRYNEIIDKYHESRKKEKEDILNDTHTFGVGYSYQDLYMSLLFLVQEINCDKKAILTLQEIWAYRKILDSTSIVNDNDGELTEIIQSIKLEIQKRTIEFANISGFRKYGKMYIDKIKERLENIFTNTEKVYQMQIKKAFGYKNLPFNEKQDSVNVLKEELEKLLTTIKNPILERCLTMLKSFYEESDDINIQCLPDNMKTLNYAISKINNRQKQDDFEELKRNYTSRYWDIIFSLIDGLVPNEEIQELEQELVKDLSLLVHDTIIVEEENNILIRRVEEVRDSYRFLLEEKEEAFTVSDRLILEIKKVDPNLEFTKDGINIKEFIHNQVVETESKLQRAKVSEIASIMNEYYRFLINIWLITSSLSSYEKEAVVLEKMI